jgi:hypothetical protein
MNKDDPSRTTIMQTAFHALAGKTRANSRRAFSARRRSGMAVYHSSAVEKKQS